MSPKKNLKIWSSCTLCSAAGYLWIWQYPGTMQCYTKKKVEAGVLGKLGSLRCWKKLCSEQSMQSAMFCCLLSHSPLPAHLAGLHLEVSSVPCAAASFVTWTLKGFFKCGKQQRIQLGIDKGKWTFWKEGELWVVKVWFIPSVCNMLVRQSQEWCLKLISTKGFYTK